MRSVIFCLLVASVASQAIIKSGRVIKPILRGVQPWEDATLEVPDAWDWTNVSGVNLVPEVRDQHAPATDASAYCGSCWAVSTSHSLSTRYAIMNQGKAPPKVELSVQEAINCGNSGSCEGGDAYGLLQYWHEHGAVDETCNPYLAKDRSCNGDWWDRCYTCNRDVGCLPIKKYHTYFVDQMGQVSGEDDMKAEIYARGPIVAAIHDPPSLKAWNSTTPDDVYEDPSGETMATHNVAIVGYGTNSKGTPFWKIQNSWGTAWNYMQGGFVKVVRGKNNLGIEDNGCVWGTLRNDMD
jgi:cathepsin X